MSDVPEPTTRENVGNLSFANHRHVESSVVITLVWLGSGKDHVWAENTWKSPQTSNTSSGFLLTNVTTLLLRHAT